MVLNDFNDTTLDLGAETGYLMIPADSIDVLLASLVLHETNFLSENLQIINQVLKTEGKFICVELEENSRHHHLRITLAKMKQELNQAGFEVNEVFYPTESIYVIIAQKKT